MDRRCSTGSCLIMAGARQFDLDLPVATVLSNPRDEWGILAHGGNRIRTAREITVDWNEFTPDKYLFSHSTIVASVETEENGYHIKPACSELVNNNGNAWSNEVLLATFRSFIGGENYLEHVQVPELSKGKILDAVIRPVVYKDSKGREANVFYTDILIATSKRHSDLVGKIASGKLNTMSMGCLAEHVQCSECGKVFGDDQPSCTHINDQLLQTFVDKKGVERIVAELCGRTILVDGKRVGDEKSCKFIEASWVARPAFKGAVLNHSLNDITMVSQVLQFPTAKLVDAMEDLFKLRVADRAGMIVLRVAREELRQRMMDSRERRIAMKIVERGMR